MIQYLIHFYCCFAQLIFGDTYEDFILLKAFLNYNEYKPAVPHFIDAVKYDFFENVIDC